ncbi:MAG: hypothetical protein AB4050_07430 [Synechococcus sp.]
MEFTIDEESDFIKMTFVASMGKSTFQLIGIGLAELVTPSTDGLIAKWYTSLSREFFNISVTQTKSEIEPDRVADDYPWKSVANVGNGGFAHPFIFPVECTEFT